MTTTKLEVKWDRLSMYQYNMFQHNMFQTSAGNGWSDETSYRLTTETSRGRDYASQLTGRATAGSLTAQLNNVAGRYASLYTAGPLYGDIAPGREVRLKTTTPVATTLWRGFLDDLLPTPGVRGSLPTAILRASGPLRKIGAEKASTAIYTSVLTGTAVGYVLDDVDWPTARRTLDAGQITMTRWKADGDFATNHLKEIEETEFGYVGESPDGNVVFEDIHHRLVTPHTVSQATFSDAAGAALSYDLIEQLDPWREIYNRIEAIVQLYTVQALAVLWTLTGEVPAISPGQSITLWAGYPTPDSASAADHVNAWTTPVATTDFLANSAIGGGGTDLTSSITISVSKFANAMAITLTNGSASTAYITFLQARGTAVYRNDPIKVISEDTDSQALYGPRTYPLPGKFYPSTQVARSYADYGISRYKDPLPVLRLTYQANQSAAHLSEALTRDVSDRITVRANGTTASGAQLGINEDFFVEAIRHVIDLSGHWVIYDLSRAVQVEGWILGVSTLGESTRLVV